MSRPRLDLDEHERGFVLRNQVELTQRRPDVPANNLVAQTTEVVLGERLAANP